MRGRRGPARDARSAGVGLRRCAIGWGEGSSCATSKGGIMAATGVGIGYEWPVIPVGWRRVVFLAALTLAFAGINIRGIRQASWAGWAWPPWSG